MSWTRSRKRDAFRRKSDSSATRTGPANRHIRSVADRFAALGYVAIAPALFDRIEAGFECGYSPEEVQGAMRFVANPPIQAWMLDVAAAREAIADVGKMAVTGFCLGGTLTYGAAINLPGFSVAVGYYGGQIVRMADRSPKVPTMLHFGELDAHIPMSDVETIKSCASSTAICKMIVGDNVLCGKAAAGFCQQFSTRRDSRDGMTLETPCVRSLDHCP